VKLDQTVGLDQKALEKNSGKKKGKYRQRIARHRLPGKTFNPDPGRSLNTVRTRAKYKERTSSSKLRRKKTLEQGRVDFNVSAPGRNLFTGRGKKVTGRRRGVKGPNETVV